MVKQTIIPVGRLRQEDWKFKASLSNLARPCLKIKYKKGWGCGPVVKCPLVQSLVPKKRKSSLPASLLKSLNLNFPHARKSDPACAIHRPRPMAISSSSWELPLVAVCQVTSTPDKQQNFKTCAELVREAARLGACLAFLPEAFDFIARDPAETLRLSEPLGGNLLGEYTQLARYWERGRER